MRKVDAPPEGWYPDPQSRTKLRWWDGLDWTDIRRAPPSTAELDAAEAQVLGNFRPGDELVSASRQAAGELGYRRQDAQEIIAEVRNVARAEVDRAAQEFSQRATTAARSFTPLVSEYTNRVVRWVKLAIGFAFVLFALWLAFQIIAQQSMFEWIGDRIDNLSDENGATVSIGVRPLLKLPA